MFGRKKQKPTGLIGMFYEGLPGFKQDFPVWVSTNDEGLVFTNPDNGATALLPFGKLLNYDVMAEPNFMLKYHGQKQTTAKIAGGKWYMVINYQGDPEPKRIVMWDVPGKTLTAMKAELETAFSRCSAQSYVL